MSEAFASLFFRRRRTSFKRLGGSIDFAPDDWSLLDDEGRPLARIYRYLYGLQAGLRSRFVLVAGRPATAGQERRR